MATNKAKRSRAGNKAGQRVLRFPQAKGKTVAEVELSLSPDYNIVEIVFDDKTSLNFEVKPCFQIVPELVNWKSGEYKPFKRWRPMRSE
jgi:hypothetical protein